VDGGSEEGKTPPSAKAIKKEVPINVDQSSPEPKQRPPCISSSSFLPIPSPSSFFLYDLISVSFLFSACDESKLAEPRGGGEGGGEGGEGFHPYWALAYPPLQAALIPQHSFFSP